MERSHLNYIKRLSWSYFSLLDLNIYDSGGGGGDFARIAPHKIKQLTQIVTALNAKCYINSNCNNFWRQM